VVNGKQQRAEGLTESADHLTDIVWTISKSGNVLFCNHHWQKFTASEAHSANESQEFPPREAIHQEDLARLQAAWASSRISLQEFKLEVRILRASDKQYIWHLMRVWPVFVTEQAGASGEPGKLRSERSPEYWFAICTDVHALKTVQHMFQLVMDNIPISIFWKDRNSEYLGCNKLFASDVGLNATEEIVGKNDYDNPSSKEQSDFFVQCDRRVMESGVPEYHIIEPQLRADGKQAWLDTNKIPLQDAGGNVIGVLGMYEDITERITIEQQREDFVATLTHDLKNPLLGTNRLLDLLVSGQLGRMEVTHQTILKEVRESNSALIGMIQNLLDVYRYDSIKRLPDNEHVDVGALLQSAVNRKQISIQAKNISLTLQVPDKETLAEISSHAFERVIQNLLDNALKFTGENGSIQVILEQLSDECRIEIIDNGPGIDLAEQEQLFKRFWQGTPGKKYSHGTGLGLYVCKQIVEANKGKILCNSVPGHGCSFIVTLPAAIRVATK